MQEFEKDSIERESTSAVHLRDEKHGERVFQSSQKDAREVSQRIWCIQGMRNREEECLGNLVI